MGDEFEQYKVGNQDEFAQYKAQPTIPAGIQRPSIDMHTVPLMGNVPSDFPRAPSDLQPGQQPISDRELTSSVSMFGAAAAAPFTGGMSMLPSLGILGAGAGAGSVAGQLATTGKVNANQTAGDLTWNAVAPELGSRALGKFFSPILSKFTGSNKPDISPSDALAKIKVYAATPEPGQPVPLKVPSAKAQQFPYVGPRTPGSMEPAQSTTISLHGYHPESRTMVVQFKNGKVYEYRGVPQEVFDSYKDSESQGSYFAQNIKGRYETNFRGMAGK